MSRLTRPLLLCLILTLAAAPTWAQEGENEPLNNTPIGEDTEVIEQFTRVEQRYIPRGEWSRVVRYYQSQLDRIQHGLFTTDGEIYLPLHIYCHKRISELPAAGLEAYRRRVDPLANKLFDESQRTASLKPLLKIHRFYFNSTIGAKAMLRAGMLYMELGRFRQALRMVRGIHHRLGEGHLHYPDSKLDLDPIRARIGYCLAALGEASDLSAFLRGWDAGSFWGEERGKRFAKDMTELANAQVELENRKSSDWPTVYGNLRHTNYTGFDEEVSGPAMWRFPDRSKRRPLFSGNFTRNGQWKPPTVATTNAVVGGNRLYTIQDHNVWALNIFDGKRVWRAPIDDGVELGNQRRYYSYMPTADTIRNWRIRADRSNASLALAGKWLFTIQRTAPPGLDKWRTTWRDMNILRVYDTTKNYRHWKDATSFGGPTEKREEFKNVVWLSTPVMFENQLYLAGQQEGSYKIFCLHAKTLKLQWRTMIAGVTDPSTTNYYSIGKRAAPGSVLTAGMGNIYWASQNGAIACLDATTGEKVWVARYWRQAANTNNKRRDNISEGAQGPWWLSPPILAQGRLIVAPRDSHEVLCYDANTGEIMWKSPQVPGVRVLAGVRGNKAYLVGKKISTIKILEGSIAEQSIDFDEGRMATGRPVLGKDEIFVPTADGLKVFDLETFKISREIKVESLFPSSSEDSSSPPTLGNLMIVQDVLFSTHWKGIAAFYSKNLKTRLIENRTKAITLSPTNPEPLYRRAELFQQFGYLGKALADMISCYDLAKANRKRIYKNLAQDGIHELARMLYRQKSSPDILLRALNYVGREHQVELKLLLAESFEEKKAWKKALRLYKELRKQFSGQLVAIDDRREARLDVLLDERIRGIRRHLPADNSDLGELLGAVGKLEGESGIPDLLPQFSASPALAELAWLHARWLEKTGKTEKSLYGYRKVIERYPGTPAALGSLSRLVEYYEKNELSGRAWEYLSKIKNGYAKVVWPPTSLDAWKKHWAGKHETAPKKEDKDPENEGGRLDDDDDDDDKKADGDKKKADGDAKADGDKKVDKKDGPAENSGLAYFMTKRKLKLYSKLSLVTPPKLQRFSARYPVNKASTHSLMGDSSDGALDYRQGQIVGAFPGDDLVFVFAGNRIEARSLSDWEIMWRTNAIDAGASTQVGGRYYGYYNRGTMLRKLPAMRVMRSLDRVVINHRFMIQGIHKSYGLLLWEIKLTPDKPYGYKPDPNRNRGAVEAPHVPHVVTTADRIYALTPGGKLFAYSTTKGELEWRGEIENMREGRVYVAGDRVIVLAGVGDKKDHDYRMYRYDELSGKLLKEHKIDRPLIALPDKLGPRGTLYLCGQQVIQGVEAATGDLVWEVTYDTVKMIDILRDGRLVINTPGAFELLDGRSGRRLMGSQLGEAAEVILATAAAGNNLYILGVQSLTRQNNQMKFWLASFDIRGARRMWDREVNSGYYPFFAHLTALEGGAVILSSYAMTGNYNQMTLFQGGSQKTTYNVKNNRRYVAQNLEVRRPFAYNGYFFVPTNNGIEAYKER